MMLSSSTVGLTGSPGTTGSGDTIVVRNGGASSSGSQPFTQSSPSGRAIQFFANFTLSVSSIQEAESRAEALAYSEGGYVAYSSVSNGSAIAVLRVPAVSYQDAISKLKTFGKVSNSAATSNDVTIKLVNLNATLRSLLSEKTALLRLMNTTTSVNATLRIESQLQGIDAQINSIQTQILNTNRLVDYSTITVIFVKQEFVQKLTLKLTALPSAGDIPLSTTFDAIVSGGVGPYIVNYNFGDGSFNSGQAIIHQFYTPGKYNVTAVATDAAGSSVASWILIRVTGPPSPDEFSRFSGYVAWLFVNVVEGIVEVGVVTVPLVAILALLLVPFRKKFLQNHEPKSKG
jgi:hypothetical protein